MEKKSGFKECSRCGLRNKPTAKQCDFCGQKFEVADEWELQIDALEKLSRATKPSEVSEDVSKKIEATIVWKETDVKRHEKSAGAAPSKRPTEPSPANVGPEPEKGEARVVKEESILIASVPLKEEAQVAKEETVAVTEIEPSRPVEAMKEEPIIIAPEPLKEEAQVAKEETVAVTAYETSSHVTKTPNTETKVQVVAEREPVMTAEPAHPVEAEPEDKAVIAKKTSFFKRQRETRREYVPRDRLFKWTFDKQNRKSVVFLTILMIGVALYVVSLASSSMLGGTGSWGMVIVAGSLVVVGFSKLMINWELPQEVIRVDIPGTADDEIVEICPSCHEKVQSTDERCPACGTELEPSDVL